MFRKAVNFVRNKEKENMERNKIFHKKRGGKREELFHFIGEEFAFCLMARISVCRCGIKEF